MHDFKFTRLLAAILLILSACVSTEDKEANKLEADGSVALT